MDMCSVNYDGTIVIYGEYSGPIRPGNAPRSNSNSRIGRQKRKLRSAAHWLYNHQVNRILAAVLTVPRDCTESEANRNLSKFFENCTRTYSLDKYIWVREYTKKGRPHYHTLLDIPFVDIRLLNAYWSQSLWDCTAPNAIRMHPRQNRFLKDPRSMGGYLTKYFTKCFNEPSLEGKRKFGMSQTISKAVQPVSAFPHEIAEMLKNSRRWRTDYDVFFYYPDKKKVQSFIEKTQKNISRNANFPENQEI